MASHNRAALSALVLTACALCFFAALHWNQLQSPRSAAARVLNSSPIELAKEAAQYLNRSPMAIAHDAAQGMAQFVSNPPSQIMNRATQLLNSSPAVQQLSTMLRVDEQSRKTLGTSEERDDDLDADSIDLKLAQADVRAQQLRLGMAEQKLKSAVEQAEGWLHDLEADSRPRRQRQRATRKAVDALTRLGNFQAEHGKPVVAVMGLQRAVKLTKKVLKDDARDAAVEPVFVAHDDHVDLKVSAAAADHVHSDLVAAARAKAALANALCAAGGHQGSAAKDARELFGEAIQQLSTAETFATRSTKGFLASASQPESSEASESSQALLAETHANLAHCLHLGGDLATASAMLRAASNLAIRTGAEAHVHLMPRLAKLLGGVRHDEGVTEEARSLYEEFLKSTSQPRGSVGGPNQFVELFETLQDHALTDSSLGQPDAALSSLDDVRTLQERLNKDLQQRASGKVSKEAKSVPDPALWASMARTYQLRAEILLTIAADKKNDRSGLEKALEAASHAVPMLRQLQRGAGTRQLADAINTLGNVFMQLGRSADAQKAYTESLELSRDLYGDNSPLTAATLHNVGSALQRRGNVTGALKLYRESLETLRRTLGEDNPDVAATHASIAAALKKTGQIEEASKEMDKAARVAGRGLPPGHVDRKRYEKFAEELKQKALQAAEANRKAAVETPKAEKDKEEMAEVQQQNSRKDGDGPEKQDEHLLEETSTMYET